MKSPANRACVVAIVGVAVVALAGCQGYEVPYSNRIVAQIAETSNENPVRVNIQVDGKDVFGPADLAPNARRTISIHEPDSETGRKLTVGDHTISWVLEKKGMPGKVGDAEIKLFSGTTEIPIHFSSTKWHWPNIPVRGSIDIRVTQQQTPPPAQPVIEQPTGPAGPSAPPAGPPAE